MVEGRTQCGWLCSTYARSVNRFDYTLANILVIILYGIVVAEERCQLAQNDMWWRLLHVNYTEKFFNDLLSFNVDNFYGQKCM